MGQVLTMPVLTTQGEDPLRGLLDTTARTIELLRQELLAALSREQLRQPALEDVCTTPLGTDVRYVMERMRHLEIALLTATTDPRQPTLPFVP